MRKRDIERINKMLSDIVADVDHFGLQNLLAAEWYFRNNSTKGFSWGYSASDSLEHLGKKLRQFLDKESSKELRELRRKYKRRKKRK